MYWLRHLATNDMNRLPMLLAEDDENDLLLMSRAIRKAEIAGPLHVVRDGEMVMEYLLGKGEYQDRRAHPMPVLLFLDLKMPRRSGFEVLQWMKQHEDFRRIITVVLTSSRESQDINRAYDLGANSYLVKPSTFDQLLELMRLIRVYWFQWNQLPASV